MRRKSGKISANEIDSMNKLKRNMHLDSHFRKFFDLKIETNF